MIIGTFLEEIRMMSPSSAINGLRPSLSLGLGLVLALGCSGSGKKGDHRDPPPPKVVAWTSAQVLETNLLFNSRYPSAAVDASGNALVAWQRDSGGLYDVWGKQLLATSGWQPEGTLESMEGNARDPRVAVNASGTFMVVWDHTSTGSTESAIYVRTWKAGSNMAQPVRLNDAGTYGYYPSVALDTAGNACVAWEQWNPAVSRYEIMVSQFSAGPGAWSAPRVASMAAGEDAYMSQVAMDPAGNAVVAWAQIAGSSSPVFLHAARFKAGSGWSAPMPVATGTGGIYPPFSLAMSAAGAVAAWTETTDGGVTYQVYSSRWTAANDTLSAPARLSATSVDTYAPSIGIDTQGSALVAWQQFETSTNVKLMASKYAPASGWSTAPTTVVSSGIVGSVKLSMNPNGNAAMIWQREDGSVWSMDGALYQPSSGWGAITRLENDNAGNAYSPEVHMGINGEAVAVWYQLDANGIRHIYANRAK